MSGGVSEIVLYQTEDNETRLQVRLDGGTVWLTQAQIGELFQTTPQNITLHLKAIYAEGELDGRATCKDYLQVQNEAARKVRRTLKHYNLEAILAVGYVTVTPERRFEVSKRIKELQMPLRAEVVPAAEYLDWHASHVFRA